MKRIPIFIHTPIISDKQFDCPYTKPYGYIYKITNQINGHYYIGKHVFHHPWLDKSYKGSGSLLKKAHEKYGIENFETIILEWTDKDTDELNILEKLYINIFHANELPNYNLTDGGDGQTSEAMSGENNPNYGGKYTNTPEVRKRITEAVNKPESKKKKSDSLIRTNSKPEVKKKRSVALKGKYTGINSPQHKSVVQLTLSGEFVREYQYVKQVRQLGVGYDHSVSACCKGKADSYKGFKWMYKTDYEKLTSKRC